MHSKTDEANYVHILLCLQNYRTALPVTHLCRINLENMTSRLRHLPAIYVSWPGWYFYQVVSRLGLHNIDVVVLKIYRRSVKYFASYRIKTSGGSHSLHWGAGYPAHERGHLCTDRSRLHNLACPRAGCNHPWWQARLHLIQGRSFLYRWWGGCHTNFRFCHTNQIFATPTFSGM